MSFFSIHNISNTPTLNAGLLIKNGDTGAGFIDIYEDSDNGTNKVRIQAQALASDYTLTLPANDGTNNQFLQTNGSGVLSWYTSSVSNLASNNINTADSNVSIEASGSNSISIGAAANTGAINIGTGSAARSITIGNTAGVTGLNLNSGTAGTTITGKVGIGASGLDLSLSKYSNLNVIAQIPKIKLVDNRSNYGPTDDVELGAIEFWSYDTSPASDPPGDIVGKIHITSDNSTVHPDGKLKFATALNGTPTDYMIIDSVGRIKSVNGFVNSHVGVLDSSANIDLTDKQKKGNFTQYIDHELNGSDKNITLPDAIADNKGLTIKIIFNVSSHPNIDVNIGVAGSTQIHGIIRLARNDDIDTLTFNGKKKIILNSDSESKAGGNMGSIYIFHYYDTNKIFAECKGITNNSSALLALNEGLATDTEGIS